MKIVENAFVEGRETETPYKKSTAKKDQLKLDVALENLSLMTKKQVMAPIPLHQIDPTTGKVLNTFTSRMGAARYIVNEVLKRPEKNPLAITGNLDICMRAGWKAYGFYWKLATPASIAEHLKPAASNAKRIFVRNIGKDYIYNSIEAAAQALDVSATTVRQMLIGKTTIPGKRGLVVQEYNPTPRVVNYNNTGDAVKALKISHNVAVNLHKNKLPINNIRVNIVGFKGKTAAKYNLYQGGRLIGRFNTVAEIAKIVGNSHRTTISKRINQNKPLGEFNQFKVKKI